MRRYLTFALPLMFFISFLPFKGVTQVKVGKLGSPAHLEIFNANDQPALIWDGGDATLKNSQDAIIWNRAKFRILLDADDNNGVSSQFSLFSDTLTGDNEHAQVNFDLNGGNSWIDSGNFGIGTKSPGADLEINGDNNTSAIIWDNNSIALRHHFDMLVSKRGWMRFLVDADKDDDNAQFAIYNNVLTSTGATPVVKFHLDGDDSWLADGRFGINTTTPSSTLHIQGSVSKPINLNHSGIPDENEYTIITIAGTGPKTLPAANSCPGRIYVFKWLASGGTYLTSGSGDKIENSTSNYTFVTPATITVQSDGNDGWWIIGKF